MERLQERLQQLSGGRILDIGTGVGEIIPVLRDGFQDFKELIGVDFDPGVLKLAREKYESEKIRFYEMDALNLEFEENSFETVCLSNSLHHLEDVSGVLTEMRRVLKPGGLLLIIEMFRDEQQGARLSHLHLHHLAAALDRARGQFHRETYRKAEIIDIIRENKLQIKEMFEDRGDGVEKISGDDQQIKTICQKVDKALSRIKDTPEYETLRQRGEVVKERLLREGFKNCTELIILAGI